MKMEGKCPHVLSRSPLSFKAMINILIKCKKASPTHTHTSSLKYNILSVYFPTEMIHSQAMADIIGTV